MPPPKSLAMLAMLRPKKKPPTGDDEAMEGEDEEPGGSMEEAMNDLLAAIKTDDPKAMADAFSAALDFAE